MLSFSSRYQNKETKMAESAFIYLFYFFLQKPNVLVLF